MQITTARGKAGVSPAPPHTGSRRPTTHVPGRAAHSFLWNSTCLAARGYFSFLLSQLPFMILCFALTVRAYKVGHKPSRGALRYCSQLRTKQILRLTGLSTNIVEGSSTLPPNTYAVS
eukprot:4769658-Amphidinium_carterae.1